MSIPEKHKETAHAWVDGAEIEILNDQEWIVIGNPSWYDGKEYRVKPVPKPDVVRTLNVSMVGCLSFTTATNYHHNLKLTFDADGNLKDAEVLK